MWELISYSNLQNPLKPYKSNYSVGIAENDQSKRKIVQIDPKYSNKISIGMYGAIECISGVNGDINVFIPILDHIKSNTKKLL